MRKKKEEIKGSWIFFISIIFLSSCILQEKPIPQNYSSTNQTTFVENTTQVNETLNTTIAEPPKPVLLPVEEGMAVYILDTETKGTTIITLNNKSMLINSQGGADGLRIIKTLKNLFVERLSYFIITNGEEGNIVGVTPILLRENPENVIHSGIPSLSPSYGLYNSIRKNITIVPRDELFVLDEAIIKLLVPYDDGQAITNDSSILIKLSYGNTNILSATDCAVDCESRIKEDIRSDIIISNGGCDSLSFVFLLNSKPKLVVFSGTPCEETLNRVTSLDIPLLRTDNDGDVVITSDGKKYEYKSLKAK